MILALETSCDDTCAAVITDGGEIRSNVVSSQGVHDRFGGVVPEIASRHHLELVNAVIDDALQQAETSLDEIDRIAVTQGPGLVGALLVGVATAKALAAARQLPLVPVDLLGQTLDDAAGEAFDKGARLLGLGYPGGPALSKLAAHGDATAFTFPTAAKVQGLDFSFAGLKTALLYKTRELGEAETRQRAADLAAGYEHAIVTSLMDRVERALDAQPVARLAIGGGVAANRLLRERAAALGAPAHIPPGVLCTDNAAMIGSAARFADAVPFPAYLDLDAYATAHHHAL
jgi:N6-L-threonylcarbamoyladenine synthase